jgi:hypothetical protein
MIIKLLNLAKLKDSAYRLTLETNGQKTKHRIVFVDDFVPRISEVDERLRPILVNNPQAAQQIIQSIQKTSKGEEIAFPIRLINWKEEAVPEKIAA